MIAMDKLHSLHATYLTRKVVPKCEYCQKDFGITRLRHLCKRCNRIICSSCGSTRRTVVTFDMKTTHKVCPICEKEGHFQYTFKTLNQTKWGQLSVVGEKWREKCVVKNENSNVVEETYAELVQIVENADSEFKDFSIIEKDVLQGRSDKDVFNYSMQEFLYYNQEGLNQKDIQLQMARVLKAFCVRHSSIGYCQGMNYMAVFLLSLMDEESAFLVLNHIVTRLLPQNFYTQTTQGSSLMGFHQEKFVLYSLAKERLNFDEAVGEKVRMFLDVNGPGFLIPLFVNYLNFQVLFLVWNQVLLSQSMNEIRKITLYLIENLLERIKSDTLEKSSDLVNVIINMFTAETFELAQKIVIDDEKVHELEEQFKHEYSSKWISNDAYVYYTLQKYTHFKKNEILTLQEQYAKFVESNKEQGHSTFGVGEHQLKEIVALMITEDQKKLNYLDSLDFHSMFKIFDIDKTGYLDFKEFLSCLSMITRGNMFEKTECAFQIFDKDEKGYLTSTEYAEFVKSIIEASRVMVTVPDLQFDEDLEKLREKLLEISKRKDRVQYIDVRNALSSDDFVEFLDNNEQARQRGSTVAQIQKSLNAHSPKMEPTEVPIQEENEEELLEKE